MVRKPLVQSWLQAFVKPPSQGKSVLPRNRLTQELPTTHNEFVVESEPVIRVPEQPIPPPLEPEVGLEPAQGILEDAATAELSHTLPLSRIEGISGRWENGTQENGTQEISGEPQADRLPFPPGFVDPWANEAVRPVAFDPWEDEISNPALREIDIAIDQDLDREDDRSDAASPAFFDRGSTPSTKGKNRRFRKTQQRSRKAPSSNPPQSRRPFSQQAKQQFKRVGQASVTQFKRGCTAVGQATKTQAQLAYRHTTRTIVQHRWAVAVITVFVLVAGSGTAAMWWLSRIPPVPECEKISTWSVDAERLYCAQVAAQSGQPEDIQRGINLVKHWSADHPLYTQGQRSLEQWSNALLSLAREKLNQGDLDGAIQIAQTIPESSPLYGEVKDSIQRWQTERNRGQKLYDRIMVALKQQSWNESSDLLAKLTLVDDPKWQNRLSDIRKQIDDEKLAGYYLKQAQAFVKGQPVETWGQAIALTDPINRKTFVWQAALKEIQGWRDRVLKLAAQKLSQKDIATASRLIQSIPQNIELTEAHKDLVALVHASELDGTALPRQPLLQQLGRITLANFALQHIDRKSPFSAQAVALQPRLDMQAEDAFQITVAQSLANLGQVPMLQAAIGQIQHITPKRPRRIEAQTFLAQWRKDIERLEDRPILVQAQQLAQAGTVEQLRQAILLAAQILPKRALRVEAQTQMSAWNSQIQTLEDRPILVQARTQAQSGQLGQAIKTANRIAPKRALHREAQQDIANWADQLQAIADRATLDRATGLAAEGSLTRAIELASQVSSRSVYPEAQGAIQQWSRERAEIRRRQELKTADPAESSDQQTESSAPDPDSIEEANPSEVSSDRVEPSPRDNSTDPTPPSSSP
ncbi:hypothetical protein [Alkalinema sp. FACHB-956]|uniref:hypothetical protein n=1 Tax=Alkalinema sp. FACHB-956 TaxID=2692768 RepID=UPI0016864748|nr:hypothetical protein [Alkalinema sp. FACHB-956]MBD2325304.1 hypothetical protein [Alkalinema sp. FACHB-956]